MSELVSSRSRDATRRAACHLTPGLRGGGTNRTNRDFAGALPTAPGLFRFFLAAVGDRPTAEDLTGDVFKSAIEGLPRFRGPVEALGGWLFRIAHHDLSDFRRKQARSPNITPLDDTLDEAALAAGADDSEELAIQRIEGERVLAALQQLSPDQREVLLLRMAAGLTAPEVAAIVGKTTGAVKALQHRGVASLARVLGVTNDTSSPEPQSLSFDPTRLTRRVEQGRACAVATSRPTSWTPPWTGARSRSTTSWPR